MSVVLAGTGLHGGRPSTLTLSRRGGPVSLRSQGLEAPLSSLELAHTRRSTAVRGPFGVIGTVEHALAALAGAGIHEGVALEVDGDELPLLDGCASALFAAVSSLGVRTGAPALRVALAAVVEVDGSRFEFSPGEEVRVEVRLEWDDDRLAPSASWAGDRADFASRIAPARTFAFERDLPVLAASGLARHVDPESVVVIAREIHAAGRPFEPDEPARHKLLDLLGDAYLHGGPPRGSLVAHRPGHAANHAALRRALELGVLVRE